MNIGILKILVAGMRLRKKQMDILEPHQCRKGLDPFAVRIVCESVVGWAVDVVSMATVAIMEFYKVQPGAYCCA